MSRSAANFSFPLAGLLDERDRPQRTAAAARPRPRLLPLQFRFDRDELARLLQLAHELPQSVDGGAGTRAALGLLGEAAQAAAPALPGSGITPREIEQWVRCLRASLAALARQIELDGDPYCRLYLRDRLSALSQEQSLRG